MDRILILMGAAEYVDAKGAIESALQNAAHPEALSWGLTLQEYPDEESLEALSALRALFSPYPDADPWTEMEQLWGGESYVLMANPGVGVSTRAAYEAMDRIGYSGAGGRRLFVNDLEKYTLSEQPAAAELKRLMLGLPGADEVLMSGSGPTIVAYYRDEDKAMADREVLAEALRDIPGARLWMTATGDMKEGIR
jgi:hypothetical protein